MINAREMLNDFQNGVAVLSEAEAATMGAFMNLQGAACSEGALSVKTKELISIAIGVYNRCQYCIVVHTYNALKAGATRKEILEAAMVVIAGFGAGPSLAYSATVLNAALDEFENDFK